MNESDLYEPIKQALVVKFKIIGNCFLEVTANKIPEIIKKYLEDDIVYILETEKKRPDLMGFVTPTRMTPQTIPQDPELIVVEIKPQDLAFKDLYQLKMYAELLSADHAFLISPNSFKEARKRFLIQHPLLKFIAVDKKSRELVYRNITTLTFREDGLLALDYEIIDSNPFE